MDAWGEQHLSRVGHLFSVHQHENLTKNRGSLNSAGEEGQPEFEELIHNISYHARFLFAQGFPGDGS